MRRLLIAATILALSVGLAGCTLNLMPGATLEGQVTLEGALVADARVTLTPETPAGTPWSGSTDDAGSWTTGMTIRPDSYTVKVEHDDAGDPVEFGFIVPMPFRTYEVGTVNLHYPEAEEPEP